MGGFNITEKNFNISGLNFKKLSHFGPRCLKGGGEYLHFTAQFGQKTNNYALSWTKPNFRDTAWSLGVDVERSFNRAIARDYNLVAHSGSVHIKRPLNAFTMFGWHYRLRDSNVRITNDQESLQLQEASKQDGLVSASGVSLTYNSTNHPFRPNDGLRSILSAEFVGIGGSAHFLSLSYVNSAYFAIGKKGALRFRADFKTIQTFDKPGKFEDDLATVPIDERFFLGGDYQVRGYRPYAIGPKFNDTADPRGGLSMLLLSAEYDYLLHQRAQLFAFADAGNVFKDSWRQFDITRIKASVGYGVKLHIMGGTPPLVLGMGYPLNADSRSDIKRFFISIGAKF
jgi:outer membrane protein insertion porin family